VRVWFREIISPEDVSFDIGIYLLRRDRAESVSASAAKPFSPVAGSTEGSSAADGGNAAASTTAATHETEAVTGEEAYTLTVIGEIPPELWNKVGIRNIPKLRAAQSEPHLSVNFALDTKGELAANLKRDLEQALH
jgi:hypothetical protein